MSHSTPLDIYTPSMTPDRTFSPYPYPFPDLGCSPNAYAFPSSGDLHTGSPSEYRFPATNDHLHPLSMDSICQPQTPPSTWPSLPPAKLPQPTGSPLADFATYQAELSRLYALNAILVRKNSELHSDIRRLSAHQKNQNSESVRTSEGRVTVWMAMGARTKIEGGFGITLLTGNGRTPTTIAQVAVSPTMTMYDLKTVYLDDTYRGPDKLTALKTMRLRISDSLEFLPPYNSRTLKDNGLRQGSKVWVSFGCDE